MRGDRPQTLSGIFEYAGFTPHARGSTISLYFTGKPPFVYPACAGIDLKLTQTNQNSLSLPRMRGDRPDFSA